MEARTQGPGRFASCWAALESKIRAAREGAAEAGGLAEKHEGGESPQVSSLAGDQTLEIVYQRLMRNLRLVAESADAVPAQPPIPDGLLTPESVAARVRSFGMDVYDAWRDCYADLAEEEADAAFGRLVEDALDQGLREAEGVVASLKVFSEDLRAISNFVSRVPALRRTPVGADDSAGATVDRSW